MEQPKKIVVGLDFEAEGGELTEGSRDAARRGLWLAELLGAGVDFVHSTYRGAEDLGVEPPRSSGERAERLDALCDALERPRANLIETDERPGLALVGRVVRGEGDLVVVAKRNTSRTEDRWLGSVSLEVMRLCPGPVWVVKPGQPMQHQAVVAATDLTPVGDRVTELGAMVAAAERCALHVVHTWQLPLELAMRRARIGEEQFALEEGRIEDAARRHIEALPGLGELDLELHLARGAPSRYIQGVVHRVQPDLAVLGTVSRGGIAGFLIGNTAEKLVYSLDCSLLTIKPEDFVSPVGAA